MRPTVRRDAGGYAFEHALSGAGFMRIAGADEAGRGACAGPLVAAAVVLPWRPIEGLDDSKKLTPRRRERLYSLIVESALAWSVVSVGPEECDEKGIQVANIEALRRAVALLQLRPDFVMTDGFEVDGLGVPSLAMWKGDAVSASVAAASIVAKVTRDRQMVAHHQEYPEYGFDGHKGYVTSAHQQALVEHGPCAIHRRRFANVAEAARLAAI